MKRFDIDNEGYASEKHGGPYVLAEEALALEARVKELEKELAAYQAQPLITITQLHPGTWSHLIEKPTTTEHLDKLLDDARQEGLEEAARICDKIENNACGSGFASNFDCAEAIRAMKEQS